MDWRDSNIILGEQMNTRGYDSSKLLPSHKGVGILRPDGDTETGADAVAMIVRSDYMPNDDWTHPVRARPRAPRSRRHPRPVTPSAPQPPPRSTPPAWPTSSDQASPTHDTPPDHELPEPLASVVGYLGADLDDDGREFIPTAELAEALTVEPTAFGRQMGELGCRPRPGRVTTDDGTVRQVRGYLTADIRTAIATLQDSELGENPL